VPGAARRGGCHEYLNPTLIHKLGWLSPGFFAVRYVIYGVVFSAMAAYFANRSRQQDESGDPKLSETMRVASGRRWSCTRCSPARRRSTS